ncbi:U11/U12 small nuclear ribonucleoprotein 35 kDa protein-like [Uranotaenia lowii]|uniref:U11/U12 small nuclear ribonucleoprotein 35 kDa protein-like n=1 Tax=Uranotaenia lowii TaxID=190385 RepID=UPI00247A3942|nr:U11/U12 small nuclear ribonucleoprotein 35 kDa protein-like [Uranotaenia lowii]
MRTMSVPSDSGHRHQQWSPYVRKVYDPIKVGSIDGTDEFPHDRALVRAMNSSYKPNRKVVGDPYHTAFVGRLEHTVTEERLRALFERIGTVVRCRLVKDIVTGLSRGYGFVEFSRRKYVERAIQELNGRTVDGKDILVDEEWERRLKDWKPRRLGGGFGGRKQSQQLRFGCKELPWRKPSIVGEKYYSKNDYYRKTSQHRKFLNKIDHTEGS